MLNISENAPIVVPFTDGGKVVKINGKPVVLEISPFGSIAHRNAVAELSKQEDLSDYDKLAFIASRLLNGHENLLNDGEPIDCSDKDLLFEQLKTAQKASMFIIETAKKRKAWTLEESNSTPEN